MKKKSNLDLYKKQIKSNAYVSNMYVALSNQNDDKLEGSKRESQRSPDETKIVELIEETNNSSSIGSPFEQNPDPMDTKTSSSLSEPTPDPIDTETSSSLSEPAPDLIDVKISSSLSEPGPDPMDTETSSSLSEQAPDLIDAKTSSSLSEQAPDPIDTETSSSLSEQAPDLIDAKTSFSMSEPGPDPIDTETSSSLSEPDPNPIDTETSSSLSEQDPDNLKNNNVNTDKEQYEINIKNNHNHPIKVSIIMPTYNKYHQLSLSLYGLSKQTFPHIEYEVILIDDCSTDNTPTLFEETDVPFKLKYIRLKNNKGRSFTRNIGIKHSEGEILIFVDGEMLVPPKFIENHYKHHVEKLNLVVTGAMHYEGLYTFIFPDYNTDQWILLDSLAKNNSHYFERYEEFRYRTDKESKAPYQLVTKDDIDKENYKALSFPNRYFLNSGVKHFENNLSEFKLPYIAFLSGNVSVRKEQLDKVGYFDESFVGYGAEDWEIGYRLYKNGVQFVLDPLTVAYHQEHPVSTEKVKEQWGNHYRLIKKHPNLDILILALEWRGFSFSHIHETVVEYEQLDKQFPHEYEELKKAFQVMLFKVIENLHENKPVTKLYELPDNSEEKINIQQQFSKLRPLGLHYLASSFEQLNLL